MFLDSLQDDQRGVKTNTKHNTITDVARQAWSKERVALSDARCARVLPLRLGEKHTSHERR